MFFNMSAFQFHKFLKNFHAPQNRIAPEKTYNVIYINQPSLPDNNEEF